MRRAWADEKSLNKIRGAGVMNDGESGFGRKYGIFTGFCQALERRSFISPCVRRFRWG